MKQKKIGQKQKRDLEIAERLASYGDFMVLEAFCLQAVESYPNDGSFWSLLGLASLRLNHLELAKTAFKKAERFSLEASAFLIPYLELCLRETDVESALDILERAFASIGPDQQYAILTDLCSVWFLMDAREVRARFCRGQAIEFKKYLGVYRWLKDQQPATYSLVAGK